MKKITYEELIAIMRQYNRTHGMYDDSITGVIVYSQDNFEKPYTLEERSYRVSSQNRFFEDGKIANSVFGSCLDGKDIGVRLDWYDWKIEYCYME